MPIFMLGKEPKFPPPQLANPEGIIATGGELTPPWLLNAYCSGIFPWFCKGEPILWWSPDPRLVLLPDGLHLSRSNKKLLRSNILTVSFDTQFEEVIKKCAEHREGQDGTWITDEMQEAYINLHRMGFAHSVEVWEASKLVGGLYGVSVGLCFFGESMFSRRSSASKIAYITLFQTLFKKGFVMMDCQVPTGHLIRMGAVEMSRPEYLELLCEGLKGQTLSGSWSTMLPS